MNQATPQPLEYAPKSHGFAGRRTRQILGWISVLAVCAFAIYIAPSFWKAARLQVLIRQLSELNLVAGTVVYDDSKPADPKHKPEITIASVRWHELMTIADQPWADKGSATIYCGVRSRTDGERRLVGIEVFKPGFYRSILQSNAVDLNIVVIDPKRSWWHPEHTGGVRYGLINIRTLEESREHVTVKVADADGNDPTRLSVTTIVGDREEIYDVWIQPNSGSASIDEVEVEKRRPSSQPTSGG